MEKLKLLKRAQLLSRITSGVLQLSVLNVLAPMPMCAARHVRSLCHVPKLNISIDKYQIISMCQRTVLIRA
jgi:hypothetical protein